MKQTLKRFFVFFTFLLILNFITFITVKADIGPKPSITITVTNLGEGDYKATLLGNRSTGPHLLYEGEADNTSGDIGKYVGEDGFSSFEDTSFTISKEKNSFTWGYYPPDPFKVLIIDQDNNYYLSEVMSCYAFYSYYEATLDSGVIELTKSKSVTQTKDICSFFLRLIGTLIIETLIALLFMYRSKKELLTILIINTITQIGLNVFVSLSNYYSGKLETMFAYFGFEIIIVIVEAIVYLLVFKEKKLKAILYSIVANVVSFGLGLIIFMGL